MIQILQKFLYCGTIKAGYNYLSKENTIGYILFKLDSIDTENYYALNVVGDSMTPLFDNGDTIIFHKQTTFENGENCIVLVDDGEYVIQKVYKTNTGIELKSVNPYYPPRIFTEREMNDLPIQVIGVVEKLIRNLKKTKSKNKKS